MPEVTAQMTFSIGGVQIVSKIDREGTGQISHDLSVAKGKLTPGQAGALTTRSGNNAGVATLSTGHGILTGDKVDVYWNGGVQYNCAATVSGNAVTLASGLGDNLPNQNTSVVVCKRTVISTSFNGDLIELLGAVASVAGHVHFQQADGTHIDAEPLTAGEAYQIIRGTGTNPLAESVVGQVSVSVNDTGTTAQLQFGALYDSV